MNKLLLTLFASIASLLMLATSTFAQLPNPCYGWNLGNTLEATWGAPPSFTQALFTSAASAGFNTIRIPCAWDFNSTTNISGGVTNYVINPSYMAQVKQAVDWSLAAGMTVVLNDHWDGGWLNLTGTYNPTINAKMNTYWSQIATTFAGYDNRLLFAAANEPDCRTNGVLSTALCSELFTYYQTFVNAVRAAGGNNTNRWLVLQGPNADIDETYSAMNTLPSDSTPGRLMVEIHYYSPVQFLILTSDVSWGTMAYFWGNGYQSLTLPSRNANYDEEAYMNSEFQKMTTKFVNNGIPVMIGEYGTGKRTNLTGSANIDLNYASATYFTKTLVKTAHSNGLSPMLFSTPGAILDWNTGAVVDQLMVDSLTQVVSLPPLSTNGGPVANGTYKIEAQNSGLAMDASGWQTTNGTQIQQWSYTGGANQLWTVTNLGNNQYSIIGVQSGKSIDINGWSSTNGTKVQLWDYSGGANQQYTFTETSSGYYRITPMNATNSCLDVNGYSTADGGLVQLWTYGGGSNEQWAFETQ